MTLLDLNGDGKLDIVVTSDGTVSVLLGKGDATFADRVDSPAAGRLLSAALGDLNGDGKLDIALTIANDGSSGSLGVLLGTGSGTFGTSLSYPTGDHPSSVALGDLNGDGKLDIVTASSGSDSVSVLLATREGFAADADYATGAGPGSVALGDVNGDGRLDIVTANSNSDTVSVLLGTGDGKLTAKVDYATGDQPAAVALGDLNGDGKPDIVTTGAKTSWTGVVNVLLGTGGGKFAASVEYAAGRYPRALALGDLNSDGKLDIVVANMGLDGGWSLSVLLGNGDGTFAPTVDYESANGPNSVALADLNGDGRLDIVTASSGAATTVNVLLGKGDGTFAARVDYVTAERPHSVALGDVNGDGKLDVVTTDLGSTMSVLLGNGDGTFPSRIDYAASSVALALGDLNGDGKLDVVAAADSSSVDVLLSSCQ